MTTLLITYLFYLLITVALTIWVARTLFRNGKIFLMDIFHGNADLTNSVSNLLITGFYLINIGYAVYTLKVFQTVNSPTLAIEILSYKIGTIILILGFMHFLNMFIFFKLRKRANEEKRVSHHVIDLSK